jgi:hypothetical protein
VVLTFFLGSHFSDLLFFEKAVSSLTTLVMEFGYRYKSASVVLFFHPPLAKLWQMEMGVFLALLYLAKNIECVTDMVNSLSFQIARRQSKIRHITHRKS